MVTLRDQIERYKRTQLIMGAALIAVCAGFCFLGYRPLTSARASLASEITEKQNKQADIANRLQILPAVAADVRQLRMQLQGQKKLPLETDLAQFIRDLTRLGDNWSLKAFRYKPEASRRNEYFAQLPIQLTFEGDFVKVFSFLKQVEDLERLTRVRDIQFKSREQSSGQVQVELTMNIFYSPQE